MTMYLKSYLLSLSKIYPQYNDVNKKKMSGQDIWIVVDVQNDFLPKCKHTSRDGTFAVTEGDMILSQLQSMLSTAMGLGSYIVVTRDYHPEGHVSFNTEGGPFPAHCVRCSDGSMVAKPLVNMLKNYHNLDVVFKGIHKHVDSFGAFPYCDTTDSSQRLSHSLERGFSQCCGWTGSYTIDTGTSTDHLIGHPDNEPLEEINSEKKNLTDYSTTIKRKITENKTKQIFVTGLAGDYCVMDTAINLAQLLDDVEVYIVLDLTRFAWLPLKLPIGIPYNEGTFLTKPSDFFEKVNKAGVKLITTNNFK